MGHRGQRNLPTVMQPASRQSGFKSKQSVAEFLFLTAVQDSSIRVAAQGGGSSATGVSTGAAEAQRRGTSRTSPPARGLAGAEKASWRGGCPYGELEWGLGRGEGTSDTDPELNNSMSCVCMRVCSRVVVVAGSCIEGGSESRNESRDMGRRQSEAQRGRYPVERERRAGRKA